MLKQGETKQITLKEPHEFKAEGEEAKKTSVITMQNGKPTRIYFENGKQVKTEILNEN